MSFYDEHCLPHLIHCACGLKVIQSQREKIVPVAEGRVLEVGDSTYTRRFGGEKVD